MTRAKLKGAIVDAAKAYIDAEVASGDVDSDDAADLKDRADDDLGFAIKASKTKTVAANLGITVAALNDGFRAARKALFTAKINKALANGDITADEAADLKDELDDADLPGYKALGSGGFDLGYGHERAASGAASAGKALARREGPARALPSARADGGLGPVAPGEVPEPRPSRCGPSRSETRRSPSRAAAACSAATITAVSERQPPVILEVVAEEPRRREVRRRALRVAGAAAHDRAAALVGEEPAVGRRADGA